MDYSEPVKCTHIACNNRATNISKILRRVLLDITTAEMSVVEYNSQKGMGEVGEFDCTFHLNCSNCGQNVEFEWYYASGDRLKQRVVK